MNGPPPQMGFDSKLMMTFPKRHSTFYIGTAGSKTFGRGDTITHLHCTEYAFWEVTREHTAGLFQAAAFAKRIVIECTANGFNHFYRMAQRAEKGRGDYRLHFFGWYQDPYAYRDLDPDFQFEQDDLDYFAQMEEELHQPLTPEQRYWYIMKREEFMETDDDTEGMMLMKQEYPTVPEEAFIATGAKVFRRINYEERKPVRVEGRLRVWEEPVEDAEYVIGSDISGGLGRDYSVVKVIRVSTLEEVASYRNNWISPSDFAHKLDEIGRLYNEAFIVPESNNHGVLTIDVLKRIYPISRLYHRLVPDAKYKNRKKKVLGFLGSYKSVIYSLNTLKLYIRRGLLIHDSVGFEELRSLEETDSGNYEAPEGQHDDCAKSYGHACVGIRKLGKLEDEKEEVKDDEKKEPEQKKNIIQFPWGTTMEDARRHAIGQARKRGDSLYGY
jgi:hypothetical protein